MYRLKHIGKRSGTQRLEKCCAFPCPPHISLQPRTPCSLLETVINTLKYYFTAPFLPAVKNIRTCIVSPQKIHRQDCIGCLSLWWWLIEIIYNTPTVQFSLVAQLCLTLCDPMNRSTPGLPVHHQLPEFTQTHAHWVGDAIQPSHPLSSPSPPAFNLSQHQGLFRWVSSSHQVAKVLEFQLQRQSFQWTPRTDLL